MARDHARLYTSIWSDDDWRALTHTAQWLYKLLLSQQDLTYAGVTDLRPTRWAASATDMTVTTVEAALAELERRRFVVIDRRTEEVLVRSYLRGNEVWKQPKLLTLALRQVVTVHSSRLRSALRSELLRLPPDPRTGPATAVAETLPDTPWETHPETPGDTPPIPHAEPLPEPLPEPMAEPMAEPPRAYAAARVTSNQEHLLVPEVPVGGVVPRASAHATPPAGTNTPTPPSTHPNPTGPPDPATARCLAHQDRTKDPGSCTGCKHARLAAERAAAQAEADTRAAIRACRLCDADGRRLDLLGRRATATRCNHQPHRPEPEPDGTDEFARIRTDAETVPCPDRSCPAVTGQPCRGPDGQPLRAPAHAVRIAAARTAAAAPDPIGA